MKDTEFSDEEVMSRTTDLSPQKLFPLVQQVLQQKLCGIEHAINATGIILHTGLGRAPLAEEAAKQLQNILKVSVPLKSRSILAREDSDTII